MPPQGPFSCSLPICYGFMLYTVRICKLIVGTAGLGIQYGPTGQDLLSVRLVCVLEGPRVKHRAADLHLLRAFVNS